MLDCGEGRHLVDVSLSDQPIQATDRQTCILVIIPILNFITSNLYLSYQLYILLYILFLAMIIRNIRHYIRLTIYICICLFVNFGKDESI